MDAKVWGSPRSPAPTPHVGKAPQHSSAPALTAPCALALQLLHRGAGFEVQERRNLPPELKEEHTGSRHALSRAHPRDK